MLFLTEVVDYCKYKPAALLYLTVAKPNRSTLGHKKYPTGWLRAAGGAGLQSAVWRRTLCARALVLQLGTC